ncbi:MAG: hypothetical protein HQL95_15505 [Magnetococcales bacterium]|nr:hypothetical protein [Magnetococcales bacterium]
MLMWQMESHAAFAALRQDQQWRVANPGSPETANTPRHEQKSGLVGLRPGVGRSRPGVRHPLPVFLIAVVELTAALEK